MLGSVQTILVKTFQMLSGEKEILKFPQWAGEGVKKNSNQWYEYDSWIN